MPTEPATPRVRADADGAPDISLLTRLWVHTLALAVLGQCVALLAWGASGHLAPGLLVFALTLPLLALTAWWTRLLVRDRL